MNVDQILENIYTTTYKIVLTKLIENGKFTIPQSIDSAIYEANLAIEIAKRDLNCVK